MGRSQQSFEKNEREKKRLKKKKDKLARKEERKANSENRDPNDIYAYVDEDGNLTDTPPDPTKKRKEIDVDSIEIGIPKAIDLGPIIYKGRVEFFNHDKGFGFIKQEGTIEKYFVHVNGLIDEIKENDKVTFDLERGKKGMNAINVKKI